MSKTFGLDKSDLDTIISIIGQHPEVDEACVFGSRAKGNYRNGSDVDIALKGTKLNFNITSHISYLLNEETNMPYKFDVLNYHSISNEELVKHIDRVGICFYQQSQSSIFTPGK